MRRALIQLNCGVTRGVLSIRLLLGCVVANCRVMCQCAQLSPIITRLCLVPQEEHRPLITATCDRGRVWNVF